MRSLTQREFETRLAWLDEERDRPSREDWYLMQVAAEIRRTRVKDPAGVNVSDMKLKADRSKDMPKPVSKEVATVVSKSRWLGMLGLGKEK